MGYCEISRPKASALILAGVALGTLFLETPSRAQHVPAEKQYEFPVTGEVKFLVHITSQGGLCTGAIVNERWVLTAAHCFIVKKKVIQGKVVTLTAGIINYEISDMMTRQVSKGKDIHVHPKFRWNKPSKYDVALISLQNPLVFGRYVDKINVTGEPWPNTENISESCVTYGFGGYMSTAPATTDLKKWNVTAGHGEDACPCALRFQYKRMVCVKEPYGRTRVCKCDDGGPLVCNNTVRAIAHMIWDRVECEDAVYPTLKCAGSPENALTLYMFLCPLNSWLNKYVPEIPKTPASCRGTLCRLPWTPLLIVCAMSLAWFDRHI